jgi:hypothetical protein
MQKLHMFLSSTREAVFFQDVCCCRQNRLIIPCEDPVAQKPAEKEQTRKKTHRRWSIVFGVILSSLGLVNANCGFPLHEMVTWRWNTRMIVGKHGKLTVSGTILSTVQVRMLGPPFEHKHNDKPVSRLIEQSYQLSHYGSLTCHPGVLHDVLLERINLKKNLWVGTQMMDLDRSRQWRRHDITSDLSRDLPMGSSSWSNLIFQHLVQLHQATNPAPAIQWLGRLAAPSVPNAAARDFFWESHRRNGMQSELSIAWTW